jgi:hypothetical protein
MDGDEQKGDGWRVEEDRGKKRGLEEGWGKEDDQKQ